MSISKPSRSSTPVLAAGLLVAMIVSAWFVLRGTHDEFATMKGHRDGVFSLAIAPGGKIVASGGGDGTTRIWNIANKREKLVLKGHSGRVLGLAWSPDAETIVSGGLDKSVRLWNASTGTEIAKFENLPNAVHSLAISSDGTTLAAAVENEVFYWNLRNLREPHLLYGHQRVISGLAFVPGKLELVTFANDKSVRIWDLTRKKQVANMPGPVGHCYGLAMSADGKTVACVGGGRIHLYDIENRKALTPIEPNAHILCGAAFSPDGQILAIGSQDKVIVIWDLKRQKEISRLNGHDYAVGQMAILPDNLTLITASHDSTIKLWKVR